MGWAGLRGAVGIALALSLNSEVIHYTSSEELDEATREQYRHYTEKLFGMVGGIAFLTLVINGTSSGPLLRWLGLVTPSETRKKVIENYRQREFTWCRLDFFFTCT
jgi:NhaP-type Na+/H+ or K+/H+ antiporter